MRDGLAFSILLLVSCTLYAEEAQEPEKAKRETAVQAPDSAQIAQWITDLGADDFATREKAMVRLYEAGEVSPGPLAEAAEKSGDEEVRQRARRLLAKIKTQFAREKLCKLPGMVKLESGLRYKILKDGEGESPKDGQAVVIHYTGRLVDGKEFDNTYKEKQPSVRDLDEVVDGMTEALKMMKPGSKWLLVVPPDLAYGEKGLGSKIPSNATLVFEVELLKVQPKRDSGVTSSTSSSSGYVNLLNFYQGSSGGPNGGELP